MQFFFYIIPYIGSAGSRLSAAFKGKQSQESNRNSAIAKTKLEGGSVSAVVFLC